MILAHVYISAGSAIDSEELTIAIKAIVPSVLSDPNLFSRDSSGKALVVIHQAVNPIDGFDAIVDIESSARGTAGVQHFLLTSVIEDHLKEVIDDEAEYSLLVSLAHSERTYSSSSAGFDDVIMRQELGEAVRSARDAIETMRAERFLSHPDFVDPTDPRRHTRWEDHYPSDQHAFAL